MADAPTRAQRAAALEEKRRRLDDLKKRRNQREDTSAKAKATSVNLDDYIDGLLSAPSAISRTASADESGQPEAASESADAKKETNVGDGATGGSAVPSPEPPAAIVASEPALPIKQIEKFAISTQTEPDDFPYDVDEDGEEDEESSKNKSKQSADQESAELPELLEPRQEEKEPSLLPIEQVRKDVASEDFVAFINTASKKVERMLGSPVLDDLLVDYIGASSRAEDDQKGSDESRFVSSRLLFECPSWTASRAVTDIDWSLLHRDLFLSTYHMPAFVSRNAPGKGSTAVAAVAHKEVTSSSMTPRSGDLQSDGLALVWSLAMPNRPEHIFTCGSPVTSGKFHPTEPTLVLGGCESGQLVIWDTRAGRLPVQKSALTSVVGASGKCHAHPIGCMDVIEGGMGLITSSSDGHVNYWSIANLREPVDSVQVGDSVSCFAVAPESETIVLGDDFGSLYTVLSSAQSTAQRSSRRQARRLETVDSEGTNAGHFGMVTSLSTKTLKKGASARASALSKGFLRGSGGLTLSCSVDWTVKLWAPAYSDIPLLSMVSHSYDYMSDVSWCPTHPSVFATASSNGSLGLWNLTASLEEPISGPEGIVVEPDAMSGRGLNKLRWSSDGRRIAVSSGDHVHVLTMTEEVIRPKGDEETKLMNQLMARGLISRQ